MQTRLNFTHIQVIICLPPFQSKESTDSYEKICLFSFFFFPFWWYCLCFYFLLWIKEGTPSGFVSSLLLAGRSNLYITNNLFTDICKFWGSNDLGNLIMLFFFAAHFWRRFTFENFSSFFLRFFVCLFVWFGLVF